MRSKFLFDNNFKVIPKGAVAMKRLVLIMLAVLLMGGMAEAAITTSCIDSTSRSLTLAFIGVASGDTLDSWTLDYWKVGGNSVRSANTATLNSTRAVGDTTVLTGLYNGTAYGWRFNYVTRTGAGGLTKTSGTVAGVCTTIAINQTIAQITDSATVDGRYRNFRVSDTWNTKDTAFSKIALQYKKPSDASWTWATARAVSGNAVGRDSTYLASPDTLLVLTNNTAVSTADLMSNTVYYVRCIAYDSGAQAYAVDTSNTLTVTTWPQPRWTPLIDKQQGKIGENLYHFVYNWDKVYTTWKSPEIDITDAKTVVIEGRMFGMDNNAPDSTKLWLRTDDYCGRLGLTGNDTLSKGAGWMDVDSLIQLSNRPVSDTLSFHKKYTIQKSFNGTAADTVFANLVGSKIWLYAATKDSANTKNYGAVVETTTLDPHYIDVWVTLYK